MADMSINGTDVRDRTGIFLDLMSGYFEPAEVRGTDTIIPSTGGRIARTRVQDKRRIVLTGYVTGTSAGDWASNVAALCAAFDPNGICTIAIANSYLGVGAGQSIEARAINWVSGEPMYGVLYQSWSIEFEAIAPNWS